MPGIEKDIVYATGSGRDLKLDIYRPPGRKNHRTAVLMLHGGGWRMGDKSMMELFGPELASLGFVAIAPEYRLLKESPWPGMLRDVKAAVRWTRTHAGMLDIDPDRIALQGFSAGAHLALMAGGTPDRPEYSTAGEDDSVSDRVAAVIAFFPPVEFAARPDAPGILPAQDLLGADATDAEAEKASPVHQVSASFPATFLLHGTADQAVPCRTSLRMFDLLAREGVDVEMHLYPGHTHEFVRLPSMMTQVMAEIALFLKRMVVNPEKYIRENRELNMFAQ